MDDDGDAEDASVSDVHESRQFTEELRRVCVEEYEEKLRKWWCEEES